MTAESRAVAPEADSVAVEIGDTMLVLDADTAADLRRPHFFDCSGDRTARLANPRIVNT